MEQVPTEELAKAVHVLNKKRDDLYKLIAINSDATIEILKRLFDAKWDIKPGDIVEHEGEEYRVTDVVVKVDHSPDGKPWVYGNPRRNIVNHRDRHRREGPFTTLVKNIFSDWEKVNKQPHHED